MAEEGTQSKSYTVYRLVPRPSHPSMSLAVGISTANNRHRGEKVWVRGYTVYTQFERMFPQSSYLSSYCDHVMFVQVARGL